MSFQSYLNFLKSKFFSKNWSSISIIRVDNIPFGRSVVDSELAKCSCVVSSPLHSLLPSLFFWHQPTFCPLKPFLWDQDGLFLFESPVVGTLPGIWKVFTIWTELISTTYSFSPLIIIYALIIKSNVAHLTQLLIKWMYFNELSLLSKFEFRVADTWKWMIKP